MAVTTITPIKGAFNSFADITFTAATAAADGFEFTMPKASDEYVVIAVQNANAATKTMTLKKPVAGSYASAGSDLVKSLGAGTFAFIRIESARFADTKGKVKLIPEATDVKIAVLY